MNCNSHDHGNTALHVSLILFQCVIWGSNVSFTDYSDLLVNLTFYFMVIIDVIAYGLWLSRKN